MRAVVIFAVIVFGLSGVAAIVMGPLLIVFGVKGLVGSQHFRSTAVATNGVVVDRFDRDIATPDGGATQAYPVVRFTTARGEVVQFDAGYRSAPPSFHVGSSVRLLYDPAHPKHVRFNTWSNRLGFPALEVAGGVFDVALLGSGVWWFLVSDRRHPVVPRR